VIVFPADYVDDASRLIDIAKVSQQTPANGGKAKWLFVFLDGSWREARKIFRRSEFLQSLPVLSVSPEHVSEYLMRRSENEQHLSTRPALQHFITHYKSESSL